MPRNFSCPTCGAPLEYDGDDAAVRCAYCGNTVIVPAEMRAEARPPDAAPVFDAHPFSFDLASLLQQAGQFGEVARLVRAGRKIDAIQLYRELTGVGLKEAKDAVEQLEAGQVLQVSRLIVHSAGASGAPAGAWPDLDEVRRLLAAGRKVEAVKLYREQTGLGLKESKDAVEAIAAGREPPDARTARKLTEARREPADDDRPSRPPARTPAAPRSRGRAQTSGCLLVFIIILAIPGLSIVLFGSAPLMLTGSFRQAVRAVQNDTAVTRVLGEPVQVVWWRLAWGEMNCGSRCSTNYSFYIAGPRGGARVQVYSDTNGGFPFGSEDAWDLDLRVYFDESGDSVSVRGTPTPEPTLSLAQADATAGAVARATRQVAETATAEAVARARQTATTEAAVARETAVAETTAQDLLAAQAGWATTVISETYRNNANGWRVDRYDDGRLVLEPSITEGVYRWNVNPSSGGHSWNLLPGAARPVTDFIASVDVRVTGGAGGVYIAGLAFRAEGRDYGLFGVNTGRAGETPDPSFRLLGVYGGNVYQLYDYGSDAIRAEPGAFNRLTVRALGPDFVFQINGRTVFVWNQPDLNDGRVGLGVDIGREGADAVIEFDNFEIVAP